mgnify:CR=1 FL=1
MEAYSSRELLCIPGKNKSYAIESSYVTELCRQTQLSRIPCMPEHYAGVCSYKGNIIPVIKLHSGEGGQDGDGGEDSLLLTVSCGKYQLGILFTGEPYILPAGIAEMVESPAEMGSSGIWAEKEICRHENEILFVIDMEKTVEGLIICQ